MSEKRASLEIIAPSIEEAVARGLSDLGLTEEDVEVEVLDSGSRGLFGLGSRQARVRLTIKAGSVGEPALHTEAAVETRATYYRVEEVSTSVDAFESGGTDTVPPPGSSSTMAVESEMESPDAGRAAAQAAELDEITLHVAREIVEELLDKMKVHAEVTAHFGQPDDMHSKAPLLVDVRGDDLSILIGPHAETLNALQYISSLIIGKELGRSVPLIVDVEGYRARRSQQIRQLARRMADQAIRTGRRQVLEPMPANERRLVHIELRDHPQVTTESVGEEPRRKVTIIPK